MCRPQRGIFRAVVWAIWKEMCSVLIVFSNWDLKFKILLICITYCTRNTFYCSWSLFFMYYVENRQYNSTVQSTKFNLFNIKFYFILICLYRLLEKATCTISNFKPRPHSKHNYNCGHLYLCILYHRPSRWPFDIETRYNIRDKTYVTCVDGILFLVITHLI